MAITKNSQIDLNGNEMILDADGDTTITADTDDQIDIKVGGTDTVVITGGAMALKGATPTLTIGDAGAEDTKIVFDGNAQDFYIGLDDSADDLVIGKGSAVGTTPAISVDENQKVTFTKDIEVQGDSTSGSEGGHITLRAASGGSKEFGIDVDSSNNLRIITEDDGTGDNGAAHVYVTNTGNVGIGYSSPTEKLFVKQGSVNQTIARFTGANNDRGLVIGTAISGSTNDSVITYDAVSTSSVGQHVFKTDGSERMRINSSGNMLLGTDTDDGFRMHVTASGSSEGNVSGGKCFYSEHSGGGGNFFIFVGTGYGVSTTGAVSWVQRNSVTSRSINCSGTVNASGNDYAEYMKKTDSCGTINKGDVCGVDSSGKLTDVFNNAISFVIKSTNPSYVGGDTWAADNLNLTEEEIETERQKYDRIAFSGQVPVNITGSFNVGDYVYPQANGTDIECVAKSNPTFEEYQLCVGKIWATEDDGRPLVAVKIG